MLKHLKEDLQRLKNPKQAKILSRFFKTGKGEYGEGDIFLGLKVPQMRSIAKKYRELDLNDITGLIKSKIHEERLVGILILVQKFEQSSEKERKIIVDFYLKNRKGVNNWDLVDLSCHKIIGEYLLNTNKTILYKLAKSKSLWDRRIAIVSTFAFIRVNKLSDTYKISKLLLSDKHDLIHKAVGWALREAGKKDQKRLEEFLMKHYNMIPRTTLRYAIERFEEKKRKRFLNLKT